MKICPRCNKTYSDETLSFCLDDGELLTQSAYSQDPPPTVIMDPVRQTNPQYNYPNQGSPGDYAPIGSWQANQPMHAPMIVQGQNQTLPTVSLILGVLGLLLFCCYGGFPLGIAAVITGYLGMKNADNDPVQFGGRGLAIGGMVTGGIALLMTFGLIIVGILGNL